MSTTSVDLLSELRADRAPTHGCTVCAFVSERPDAEKPEWSAAFLDKSISSTAIHRAMKRRGYAMTASPVKTHRANHL